MRKITAVLAGLALTLSGIVAAAAGPEGSPTGGTSGTQSLLAGCRYNSSPNTLSDGQQTGLNCDNSGQLKTTGTATLSGVAQGSTTAGQTVIPIGCRTLTAAPTDTTAQTNMPSCDTSGALRVTGTTSGVAQGSTTAGQSVVPMGCRTLTSAPTDTTAQTNMPSCDTAGALRVNVTAGANTGVAQGSTSAGQTLTPIGCRTLTSAPTDTTAQTNMPSCDTSGALRVNVTAGSTSGTVAQGSTTSGQSVVPMGCRTLTSAPTDTTAQTNMPSCDTAGALRVNVTTATGVAQGSTTSGQTLSPIGCRTLTSAPTDTTAQTNMPSCTTGGAMRVSDSNAVAAGTSTTSLNHFPAGAAAATACNAAAYTNAQENPIVQDLTGNICVKTLPQVGSFVSGTADQATGGTDTTLIAAVTSKVVYVTAFACINSGASTSVISFKDNTAGTTVYKTIVPAGGGSNLSGGGQPLFKSVSGDPIVFNPASSSTTVSCSASGYSQ